MPSDSTGATLDRLRVLVKYLVLEIWVERPWRRCGLVKINILINQLHASCAEVSFP